MNSGIDFRPLPGSTATQPIVNNIPQQSSSMPMNQQIDFRPIDNGPISSQSSEPWYSVNNLANNPITNGILGVGDATRNAMANLLNLAPGINIPQAKSSSGVAYNIGNFAGSLVPYAAGGEALGAARVGSEALPYIGQAASYLGDTGVGQAIGRAMGSSAYGAVNDPNNRLQGAGMGAAFSGLSEIPAYGASAISNMTPTGYASTLRQTLGQGMGLQENAKSLAGSIRDAYQTQTQNGSALYKPVFDAVGDSRIFSEPGDVANSQYGALDPSITSSFGGQLKNVANQFNNNPTFNNAHTLQSQLGFKIRKLQDNDAKGTLSVADGNTMEGYQTAQQALINDMGSFLDKTSPGLSDQYANASANWLQNVVPYTETPAIAKIANQAITNPKNISTLFSSPEPGVDKVISDIGPQANQKIIYNELMKNNAQDPQSMMDVYNKLDAKGLGSYITPEISSQFAQLQKNINRGSLIEHGIGTLGGLAASKLSGAEFPGNEIVGAALGNAAMHTILNNPLTKAISYGVQKSYRPAANATVAYNLQGNQ